MTNDHERSRLDGIIDAAVHDMMQTEGRGDLTARVMRTIGEPVRRPWFTAVPALAVASFAVVVLVAAVMILVRQPAPHMVPSIEVASGLPAELLSGVPAPRAPEIPLAAGPEMVSGARSVTPPAAPSAESIFGPRRGQVSAASVTPEAVFWLELTLIETSSSGQPRRQPVTMVLRRDAQPGAAVSRAEGVFQVAVVPEFVAGGVNLRVDVSTPVRRQFTATIRRGERERSQIFEEVDPQSGRRMVIEARGRFLGPDAQR